MNKLKTVFTPPPAKLKLNPIAAALAAGWFTLNSGSALAATINVGVDGCTLADAIRAANGNGFLGGCQAGSGADTIVLPSASVQTLTSALPPITSEIAIQGNGSTVVRDGSAPEFRIFEVRFNGNLTLNQTTVSGGLLNLGTNSGGRGGGIYVQGGGLLTLLSSTVSGNTTNDGAGIFSAGRVYLESSRVTGNRGILNFASGGINTNFGGTLTINNSVISDNHSGPGAYGRAAGIHSFESTVRITNSTISGNTSSQFGGGIEHSYGALTLISSTISGNSAGEFGGGIRIGRYATVAISNSTISGNRSNFVGGGISNFGGSITIEDSTIFGNSSVFRGGGFYTNYLAATNVSRTAITGNSVSGEGGIAGRGAELFTFPMEPMAPSGIGDNNLFGHIGLTTSEAIEGFILEPNDVTATSDGTHPTALADILDPVLSDNGGATRTHALVDGSPAVDAAGSVCSAADQRGVTRPRGVACDIGAYERENVGALPTVRFLSSIGSVFESATTRQVAVQLSSPAARNVTVRLQYGGDAVRGTDFTGPTQVIIPAGQASARFNIGIINDALDEANEIIDIGLAMPTGAVLGSPIQHRLTVIDNDALPTVEFVTGSSDVQENAGTLQLTLRLSAVSAQNVTVPIGYSGSGGFFGAFFTARRNVDYFGPSTITIPAGEQEVNIPIQIADDPQRESQETAVLVLGRPSNAFAGFVRRHVIRIAPSD